jgi:cytoskeletal protein RodZ
VASDNLQQIDAFLTPGQLLKAARKAKGLPEKEAEERLNWAPGYVGVMERDDYQALRSPAFARGYVKAYGRLVELDEDQLLTTFDEMRASIEVEQRKKVETRPVQLQRTGMGVVVGLAVLALLILALWVWRGDRDTAHESAADGSGLEVPAPGASQDRQLQEINPITEPPVGEQ